VRRWGAATGAAIDTYVFQSKGELSRLGGQLLADGRLLTWGADGAQVWSADAGAPGPTLRGVRITGAVGRILTWGGEPVARLWNGETGALETTLRGHTRPISGGLALGDGRILTWSTDGTARLWNGGTGAPGPVLRGFARPTGAMRRRSDGRLLIWNETEARRRDGGRGGPSARRP
jgi:WD40 repeat protein